MVMIFANETVRNFLLDNGIVYTYRKGKELRKQIGIDWATDRRCGKKIADIGVRPRACVHRNNIGDALTAYEWVYFDYDEDGDPYSKQQMRLAFSGFKYEGWLDAIRQLNKGKIPEYGWIYEVTIPDHPRRVRGCT